MRAALIRIPQATAHRTAVLNARTDTVDPTPAVLRDPAPAWSVVERDRFGPIASAVPIALVGHDELGRRRATFAPDGDLV
jgi:hypothetical protein